MAASDARPVPIKNTAFRAVFPILDADGDLVTGATGLDSEVSKDQGAFADCTNEATEIATSSGMYYLDLTSTEMNADCVAVIIKTSSTGAKTTVLVFYPQESGDIKVDLETIKTQTVTCSGGVTIPAATLASTTNITAGTMTTTTNLTNLPAITAGWLTAAGIAADAFTAAKFAADVTTEFQAGLATSAQISALNNLSAAEVRTELTVELGYIVDLEGRLTAARAGYLDNLNIGGTVASSTELAKVPKVLTQGTAQGGNSSQIILAASTSLVDDTLNGALVKIVSGTGAGQARIITNWESASDTGDVTPNWVTNPDATSVYEVVPASANIVTGTWLTTVSSALAFTTAGSNNYLKVDAVYISGDQTAADNLESAFDGTGYNVGNGQIVVASVTGNVGGSVGSVTGSVGSVTGNVGGTVAGIAGTITTLDALNTSVNTQTNSIVAGYYNQLDSTLTTILNRIGAFTGSGINTILGFFRALMRSDSATPSDVNDGGGSYTPFIHSTQALYNNLPSSPPSATAIADAVLSRDASNVEDTAGRHTLASIILHGTEFSITAGVMTVYKTDGVTTFTTTTLTSDPDADPITGAS